MKKISKLHFSIALLFFLLLTQTGVSQNAPQKNGEGIPLKSLLDSLESTYNVSFSYLDENVSDLFVRRPLSALGLQEMLDFLQRETNLEFTQIDDRNITISKTTLETRQICGFVRDKDSNDLLTGAVVSVGEKYTLTNEQGYFSFELESSEKIDDFGINFLGYEPYTLFVNEFSESDECWEIYLKPKPTILNEVIIPDYLTYGINKYNDGSYVLDLKKLAILPGLTESDALQSIQTLPGIQSVNETVSDINVRGGTNDQNLVLWDDVRMYQSGHFFGLISIFNPYLIKEVDLIKNGSSAKLGDGVSSTIRVNSLDNLPKDIQGGVGLSMLMADAYVRIPLGQKVSFNIAGRRSIGDWIKTPTYQQYFSRAFRDTEVLNSDSSSLANSDEKFRFYDVGFNFMWNPDNKTRVKFDFLNTDNLIEYNENALIDSTLESRTSLLEQESTVGRLYLDRLWSNKVRTSATFYYSRYNLDARNEDIQRNQRLIQENEVLDIGLKLDARVSLTTHSDLLLGYHISEVGVTNVDDINNPQFRRSIKEVLITHASIVQGNFSLSNRSNLRVGVRSNYLEKFQRWIIEPRLALSLGISDRLGIEILGEMKDQSTTQIIDFQTDFLGIEKRRWILADNDSVPVIRSGQVSVGMTYNNNDLLISGEGYLKEVRGIYSLSQGFLNQFQYVKTSGDYKAYGFDILISKKSGRVNSWISYSFAKNTYSFPELDPSSFPNNLEIPHTVTLGVSYTSNSWETSTGFNWHTGRPITQPNPSEPVSDGEINYQAPNSTRLADYWRWDISSRYRIEVGNRSSLLIGASIWNITNRENILLTYYRLPSSAEVEVVNQTGLGITPNVLVRYEF